MAAAQRASGAPSKCPFSTMNLSMMAAGALVGVAAPPLIRYARRCCSRWCCSGAGKDEEQLVSGQIFSTLDYIGEEEEEVYVSLITLCRRKNLN